MAGRPGCSLALGRRGLQLGAKIAPAVGPRTTRTNFGTAVALSADGSTALIGGPRQRSRTGAVWVYHP